MIYFDTETCGLHGVPVLLQYAEDNGPVQLHRIWQEPMRETVNLIEQFTESEVCGFNLSFDWFQLYKIYTMFTMFGDLDATPEDYIDELAVIEERARYSQLCIKPKAACDIMLHARKTKYQSLMDRDDIKIRKVPAVLAWKLSKELERRIRFDDIYFAKAKDPSAPRWKIFDIIDKNGNVDPDFKDIKLKFRASSALKNLYRHAFKVTDKIFTFRDIELDRKFWPVELGYAPYALAVAPHWRETKDWKGAWPDVITYHIRHWGYNEDARKYAGDDVIYTRRLHVEKFDSVVAGDDDSELACMVGVNRWRGYAVDLNWVKHLRDEATKKLKNFPTAAAPSLRYISEVLDDVELLSIQRSTKKVVLEELKDWKDDDGNPHPVAARAAGILEARKAEKRIEVLEKILHAGRLHAVFKVIGALSSRMAGGFEKDKSSKGGGGLNPQGINHEKDFRAAFILADSTVEALQTIREKLGIEVDPLETLSRLVGGDFKSFEVSLAAAVFKDPVLDSDLKSGIKVHAQMGTELFPGKTYQDILDSEGTADDMYDKGKKGFFLLIYQGDGGTFKRKLGIPLEIGEKAYKNFMFRRPKIKEFMDWVKDNFGCLAQPGGIGTKVEWREPKDYAESFLGFRRYFTLENQICKILFNLAQNPPDDWKQMKIKVYRRDRMQTASGALQSAIYGAAFGIASRNIRASGNHYIQNPGAMITKRVQRRIWDLQPSGVHVWLVQPMNIHDELMCPSRPDMESAIEERVKETVLEFKCQVPLLAIDWVNNITNWAGKKGLADAGKGTIVQSAA